MTSGSWFQPLWKILVKWEYGSQYMESHDQAMFQTTNQTYMTRLITICWSNENNLWQMTLIRPLHPLHVNPIAIFHPIPAIPATQRAKHQPAFAQVIPAWQVRVAAVRSVGAALAAAGVHAVGILEGLCVPGI